MRVGALPSNIYDRAVYKPVYKYNRDRGAVCKTACASLRTSSDIGVVTVSGELELSEAICKDEINLYMLRLFGETLARAGRGVASVRLDLTLPADLSEPGLRNIINAYIEICALWDVDIDGVSVRTSESVLKPQLNLSAVVCASAITKRTKPISEQSVIMTGYAAASGTRLLAKEYQDRLSARFSDGYISRMQAAYLTDISDMSAIADIASDDKIAGIYAAGEGGVYAALWNMGEAIGCGMEINLKAIPIFQESVELCTVFDINPYRLESAGVLLFITQDSNGLNRTLKERGIEASRIGRLTDGNGRVIINGEETGYLTKPEADEIYRARAYNTKERGT